MRYYTVTMKSGHTYMPYASSEETAKEYAEQLAWNIHGEYDTALVAVACEG